MKGIYKVNDVMRSNGLDAWKYCSDAEKLDYLGEMGWANLSNWEELEESIRIMGEKVAWLEKENCELMTLRIIPAGSITNVTRPGMNHSVLRIPRALRSTPPLSLSKVNGS